MLRDVLTHLYDPLYEPPDQLYEVTGCPPEHGPACVNAAIIGAIRDLEPAATVPTSVPARRFYELLLARYVEGLTQDAAAQRLGISPRHLRGLQWKAVRALARSLWHGHGPQESERARASRASVPAWSLGQGRRNGDGWTSQIRQEVESLHRVAPTEVADVADTVRGVVQLLANLAKKRGVAIRVEVAQERLLAATHPSVLRQALLVAIAKLTQSMNEGTIAVSAERHGHRIAITAAASPMPAASEVDLSFMQTVLASEAETVEFTAGNGGATISIKVPTPSQVSGTVTVLVVEDNEDLVSLYRSYVENTRYRIVHVSQVEQLLPAVETHGPDVIVLDIMLPEPETDGWELLVGLHDHAATKSVPVVVCSVVREERLALDLGAAAYVPKPVRRAEFVAALDQAISQAA